MRRYATPPKPCASGRCRWPSPNEVPDRQRFVPGDGAWAEPAGHDATHVRDVGLTAAADQQVLESALSGGRILVSADTDFGALLAARHLTAPSFILFRGDTTRRPEHQLVLLLNTLPRIAAALAAGCVAVLDGTRIRVRDLPLL